MIKKLLLLQCKMIIVALKVNFNSGQGMPGQSLQVIRSPPGMR
jgi:hypothetical protein